MKRNLIAILIGVLAVSLIAPKSLAKPASIQDVLVQKIKSTTKELKDDLAAIEKINHNDIVSINELSDERILEAQIALTDAFNRFFMEAAEVKRFVKKMTMKPTLKKALAKPVVKDVQRMIASLGQTKALVSTDIDRLGDWAERLASRQIAYSLKKRVRPQAIASQK